MKIGVLGLGSIGLRHARNIRSLGHEVIGYDVDEKKMREFQGKVFKREDVLDLNAVVIATPTNQHYADWYAVFNGGASEKHIFMEKPLCAYKDMFSIALEPDLKQTAVGYMLRFHPCVKAAKAWLDNGNIGTPIWASFTVGQFNDKPDYLRDGVVLNWSHEIDLALYLLGPAKVVAASVRGFDDIADFVLEHKSGARSTIHLDYVTKDEIREGWIVGSEKKIGLDLLGRRNSMGKIIQEFGGKWDGDYLAEINAWLTQIQKPGWSTPLATGEDGLRVMDICQQVQEMARGA